MKSRFLFTPFPNGWFRIASSKELRAGEVKPLYYFGKDLVLFRTKKGKAHVFDAHCPHLGAHLGYGGRVKGETIQCPFHGWCFSGEGQCCQIPYARSIPSKATLRAWPVCEVNDTIWIYYHSRQKLPHWEIPELPEYASKQWTCLYPVGKWKIRTHILNLAENAVDVVHYINIHGLSIQQAELENFHVEDSIFEVNFWMKYNIFSLIKILGYDIQGSYKWISYGLGCAIYRFLVNPMKFQYILMDTRTPIDEEYTELRLYLSMKKVLNKPITRLLRNLNLKDIIKATEEEIPLYEHKRDISNPLLCDGDGPIKQYRRWAKQFYDASSLVQGKSIEPIEENTD